MEGLFDAIDAKEKLKEIYAILDQVTQGDIILQNGKWDLDTKQFNEPFNLENLSAGLKAFVLIKFLLEKGILKEKDVLILDEPEIHLHPEWQLLYAEIIVLLQKKFDLSLVVTTHSSHFLEAIECYSRKYETTHKCNYYLTNMKNGLATFENVTQCLNKIYQQMVTPIFIEFKDSEIRADNSGLKNNVLKKAYSNWYMMLDVLYYMNCKGMPYNGFDYNNPMEFAKNHVYYILVCNEQKNPRAYQQIKNRDLLGEKYTPPFMQRLKDYLFKDAYIYTNTFFERKFVHRFTY